MLNLNLLSPQLKLEHKYKIRKQYLLAFLSWLLVMFLVFLAFLLVIYFILIFQINEQNIQKSFLMSFNEDGRFEEQESNVKALNNKILFFKGVNNGLIVSSLIEIVAFIPDGIKLNNLSFDTTDKRVIISGFAVSRGVLLQLKNNLELSDKVNGMNFPFSNLLKERNINFNLSFTLN